jgi:hypothetical protein
MEDVAYNGLFLKEYQSLISRYFPEGVRVVLLDTIMTLDTVVPVVIIMKKLSVGQQETLFQLLVHSQFIHYVLEEHQVVPVVQLVTEPVDTVVHLM